MIQILSKSQLKLYFDYNNRYRLVKIEANKYIKYKNYEIGYLQSSVFEKVPDYGELGEGITISKYIFGEHQLIVGWAFNAEKQKLYINMDIYMDQHNLIGAIMGVNGEKEMTQELAEQLYKDFHEISITDLKKINK